jgi:tight adherence protein B
VSPRPLAAEFRLAHEELNFGLSMDEALRRLAARVPCEDMGFLVVAVLLQRETGGNLAEVLSNIASLVRQPPAAAGARAGAGRRGQALGLDPRPHAHRRGRAAEPRQPGLRLQLWKDPVGLRLIQACAALYALGALSMWKLIRIRV